MKRSVRVSVGLAALVLGTTSIVWSFPGYGTSGFDAAYPTSTSDDAVEALPLQGAPAMDMDCLLCHGFYTFAPGGDVQLFPLDNFNEYGFAIRNRIVNFGESLATAIQSVENLNSDNNPAGTTNLQEILAGQQPGWRAGNANRIYVLNGPDLFNQPAPTGLQADPPVSGTVYCTAKPNSLGCTPQISATGVPSSSSSNAHTVRATSILNNKNGLLFYGYAAASLPFFGGTLCVQPPVRRTPIMNSFGSPPPNNCSGSLSFDFNTQIQSGADPGLITGTQVSAQYWTRDAQHADGTGVGLTNAIQFTIFP